MPDNSDFTLAWALTQVVGWASIVAVIALLTAGWMRLEARITRGRKQTRGWRS